MATNLQLHSALVLDQDTLGVAGVVIFLAALLAYVFLVIGAVLSILGSHQSGGMKLVWFILVVMAPFLGSLLWFVIGKRNTEVYRR